jgi:hypothetical protein
MRRRAALVSRSLRRVAAKVRIHVRPQARHMESGYGVVSASLVAERHDLSVLRAESEAAVLPSLGQERRPLGGSLSLELLSRYVLHPSPDELLWSVAEDRADSPSRPDIRLIVIRHQHELASVWRKCGVLVGDPGEDDLERGCVDLLGGSVPLPAALRGAPRGEKLRDRSGLHEAP